MSSDSCTFFRDIQKISIRDSGFSKIYRNLNRTKITVNISNEIGKDG